jgi:hypothetical protein
MDSNATLNVDPVARDQVNLLRQNEEAFHDLSLEAAPDRRNLHMPEGESPLTGQGESEYGSLLESPLFSPVSPTVKMLEKLHNARTEMEIGTPGYGGILSAEANPTPDRELKVHIAEGDVAPIDLGINMASLMAPVHFAVQKATTGLLRNPTAAHRPGAKRKSLEQAAAKKITANAHNTALKRIKKLEAELEAERSKHVKRAYRKAKAADAETKKHRKITKSKGKNPKRKAAGTAVWERLTPEQQKHINKRRAEGLANWKKEQALKKQQ